MPGTMNSVPDMAQYKLVQQAFGARNVLSPRAYGRKMSASALGAGIITSLPANADGILQALIGGQTVNVLLGENFASGVGGFTGAGYGTLANVSGKLEYTIINLNLSTRAEKILTYNAGDKFYIQYKLTPKYANLTRLAIGGTLQTVDAPTANVENMISAIITTINNTEPLRLYHAADTNYIIGDKIIFDDVMVVNLTENGLTSLTKEECHTRFNFMTTGTKSTLSTRVKSVGKNLFNDVKNSFVLAGVTITNNRDGSLTFNGVTTSPQDFILTNTTWVTNPDTKRAIRCTAGNSYKLSILDLTTRPSGISFNFSFIGDSGTRTWAVLNAVNTFTPTESGYLFIGVLSAPTVGTIFSNYRFSVQIERGIVATEHEPYTETISYVPGPSRSLPNGVKDEFDNSKGQKIQRVSEWYTLKSTDIDGVQTSPTNVDLARLKTNILTNCGFVYNQFSKVLIPGWFGILDSERDNVTSIGKFNVGNNGLIDFIITKGTTLEQARTLLTGQTLIYQLATPIITQYKDLGQLDARPNGSIIVEPVIRGVKLPTFGTGKITVTTTDAPLASIESVYRIDTDLNGRQSKTDVTALFTLDADKLGITYAGADASKPYEYICTIDPAYSTIPSLTYSYPESVIQDWGIASHSYAGAAADWVLTTSEAQCGILSVTNAGGAANIIAPAITGRVYAVKNNSGQTITFKSAGDESGTTILNGNTVLVFNGGGA